MVYCPFTITGTIGTLVQLCDMRFVVDCNIKPLALIDHVRIVFDGKEGAAWSVGDGNRSWKIVPLPVVPPLAAIP